MSWTRYVAIGDSTTEGIDDPDGAGGYRGWADRLAMHIAAAQDGLEYANLAVRGRTTARIRDEQIPAALSLEPDLVTLVSGVNDLLRPTFDIGSLGRDIEAMQRALTASGATVVTFTMPDMGRVLPIGRLLRPRLDALNDAVRSVSRGTGALLLDLAAHPVAGDPRLWSEDRLHANAEGHRRIAAALAHRLGVEGSDDSWSRDLEDAPRPRRLERVRAELAWTRHHLGPWVGRRVRGASSGDDVVAKRPLPLPVEPDR